jgi:hypothetical protein
MSHNVTDLRNILFSAIEGVKKGELDIDKARTINELSRTIVDTARTENDHLKITGGTGSSDFIATSPLLPGKTVRENTAHGVKSISTLPSGATVTTHKMRG